MSSRLTPSAPKWAISRVIGNWPTTGIQPWLPPRRPDATILGSMTPETPKRPRVGIPWRTSQEEAQNNLPKLADYENSVRDAGAEPVRLSLSHPEELQRVLPTIDGFVLPGSPADVDPKKYGAANKGKSEAADEAREQTDWEILKHAFAEHKPVLAICYGCQLLNVYLGGTLIQDLRAETRTAIPHRKKDVVPEAKEDPIHVAAFEASSHLLAIAGAQQAKINSSHHQAIAKPGNDLRVTAHAPDGTIEGVEWTGDANWVIGVQWHPERMFGDAFSKRLFADFIAAARSARGAVAQQA